MKEIKRPTYVTKAQLIAANTEALRLGFSHTIRSDFLESLPPHRCVVLGAWGHTSSTTKEQLKNIRLFLLLNPSAEIDEAHFVNALLDVTPDAYAEMLGNTLTPEEIEQVRMFVPSFAP